MRKIEEHASTRSLRRAGSNGSQNRKWGTLVFLCLSCVTVSAAFVTVEFDAQITGSNVDAWRVGERMIGYFEYDSDLPPGRQTNSRPVLAFGKPGAMNEFYWYDFTVYNNFVWDPWSSPPPIDGISLRFNLCCSEVRYGYLSLTTSNTSLFTNNSLPKTIPPLERFDFRFIGITLEDMQPYGTVSIRIERLSVVPGSGLGRPVIFAARRTQAGVSFRFLTEASTGYVVEFKDNLADSNWQTLINIASAREPVVTINDQSGLGQRFYRIRKE